MEHREINLWGYRLEMNIHVTIIDEIEIKRAVILGPEVRDEPCISVI